MTIVRGLIVVLAQVSFILVLQPIRGVAQSPQTQTPPATQAQPATPSTEVTLTGCLMPDDTGMHGPATTGASSPGERGPLGKPSSGYVLKGAKRVTQTSGGDEAKASSSSELEYRLMPADQKVKLDAHLRHRVEVRGQLINPEQAKDPSKGLNPDRADTAHTLKVTAVRTLAEQCRPA